MRYPFKYKSAFFTSFSQLLLSPKLSPDSQLEVKVQSITVLKQSKRKKLRKLDCFMKSMEAYSHESLIKIQMKIEVNCDLYALRVYGCRLRVN